jgi:2,3-bisphosphoglycerate-dependent phosphoglycerate mutase
VLVTLFLARHAHAASNAGDTINGIPPGEGLSPQGAAEAVALGAQLATEPIELGVSSRFRRASETLALALAGRGVPFVVEPGLDEIGFGSFEGGSLAAYRAWAWKHTPAAPCPGGGETRADAARRIAAGLGALLDRRERVILAVTHGLPLRYVIDAADGSFPGQRLASVPHAVPFRFERAQVERAAATLEEWAAAPHFADTPFGG